MSFIIDFIRNFWSIFSAMAPWLLFGYLAAGLIAYFLNPEQVKKHLGGGRIVSVLKAVLIGIPLPVCSCGVIPIANTLRNEGAGKGATGAFFIATPQIGVDSAIVTASMLGWCAAVIRAVTAFLSGVTGGILISKFSPEQSTPPPAEETKKKPCCCHKKQAAAATPERKPLSTIFTYGFLNMLKSTAPSLLLGMVIAALIQQFVPANFGAEYLCGNIVLEFAVVLIFSIPLYICSSASVPVALTLILKGFSPGAALLFLIAGPTIHSVSITSMRQIIGSKAAIIAIGAIAFWAVAAGILVNIFNIPVNTTAAVLTNAGHSFIIKNICGIILAILVMRALIVRYLKK
ncbi:MAG: permease [Lentisphaeria bacterium]|nr:permease [Lentisphaeria bacterium]